MSFYSGPVPRIHQTANFTFRPLAPDYTALGFEALMVSKPMLRQWLNSAWPDDDFTLERNRADLQRHYDEFQNGEAYAYTVLNPAESRVEDAFYIDPLVQSLRWFNVPEEVCCEISDDEAHVAFWIRSNRLADESLLFHDIMRWLDNDWLFPHTSFFTFDTSDRQRKLFESVGMSQRFRFAQPDGIKLLFYHLA